MPKVQVNPVECKAVKWETPISNGSLQRWQFIAERHDARLNRYFQILEAKHGRRRANRIIAHKMGRAVYFMLKRKEVFDYDKFLGKYKKRCEPAKKNRKQKLGRWQSVCKPNWGQQQKSKR